MSGYFFFLKKKPKLCRYWQKTIIFTWNLPPFQNTVYLKFQVDVSTFADIFWKPEFQGYFFWWYMAAYGGKKDILKYKQKIRENIVANKKYI